MMDFRNSKLKPSSWGIFIHHLGHLNIPIHASKERECIGLGAAKVQALLINIKILIALKKNVLCK
jgi:hypothetical protein